jgi:hypothetical protein
MIITGKRFFYTGGGIFKMFGYITVEEELIAPDIKNSIK